MLLLLVLLLLPLLMPRVLLLVVLDLLLRACPLRRLDSEALAVLESANNRALAVPLR